jgi:hypothetical protein
MEINIALPMQSAYSYRDFWLDREGEGASGFRTTEAFLIHGKSMYMFACGKIRKALPEKCNIQVVDG